MILDDPLDIGPKYTSPVWPGIIISIKDVSSPFWRSYPNPNPIPSVRMSQLVATWREKQVKRVKTGRSTWMGRWKFISNMSFNSVFSQSSTPNSDATITNLGLKYLLTMCRCSNSDEMFWVHPKKSPWLMAIEIVGDYPLMAWRLYIYIYPLAIKHGNWKSSINEEVFIRKSMNIIYTWWLIQLSK